MPSLQVPARDVERPARALTLAGIAPCVKSLAFRATPPAFVLMTASLAAISLPFDRHAGVVAVDLDRVQHICVDGPKKQAA
jgi:hypothetical protein